MNAVLWLGSPLGLGPVRPVLVQAGEVALAVRDQQVATDSPPMASDSSRSKLAR